MLNPFIQRELKSILSKSVNVCNRENQKSLNVGFSGLQDIFWIKNTRNPSRISGFFALRLNTPTVKNQVIFLFWIRCKETFLMSNSLREVIPEKLCARKAEDCLPMNKNGGIIGSGELLFCSLWKRLVDCAVLKKFVESEK